MGGGTLVLKALYKIPIGVLMSYSIFSITLNCPISNFFTLAGRFTLQIYLFQVVINAWIKTYTPSLPFYIDLIIFIGITWLDYYVPILLAKKYNNSVMYQSLFHASAVLFKERKPIE